MKNLNKKQKIILSIIGLCIVGLLVLGATYAWFIAVVEPGEKAPDLPVPGLLPAHHHQTAQRLRPDGLRWYLWQQYRRHQAKGGEDAGYPVRRL